MQIINRNYNKWNIIKQRINKLEDEKWNNDSVFQNVAFVDVYQ